MENLTTEYQREYTDDIKYTAVAFANTNGGKIYIGIQDDGIICGVENPDAVMLRITNMLRDAVRPDLTMFTDIAVETMQDRQVIVLTVNRGTARPYYLTGKGIRPEGVYVRQGSSSVPASETAILHMLRETGADSYENARSLIQDLTFSKTKEFFLKRGLAFEIQQQRTLHMIGEDGTYTNLAFLLSDQCTHSMKVAVFEGSKKTIFRDRKEISGSLLAQIEEAYAYIDRFNRTRSEFAGLDRVDQRDYPLEAIREALLNAIVHRDYSFSSPILISIFDDRIEFTNIGGLVRGVSYADIMLGLSVLRNQNLANVFYRLKLIEAYGTGILKINESYMDFDRKPCFEVTDHAFKLTLPNKNNALARSVKNGDSSQRQPDSDDRQKLLLQLARERGYLTRKEVEKELGVSQATAILILRKMTENGLLTAKNNGKNRRYLAAENGDSGPF